MRFNEALYFAFVIGHRGTVLRTEWTNSTEKQYQSIELCCHPSDDTDNQDYLHVRGLPFPYVELNDELKNNIQLALRNPKSRFCNRTYGLPITNEDLISDDWYVNKLLYTGTRF